LAKEIALSPTELKKAAQKIGFTTTTAAVNKSQTARPTTINKAEKPRVEKSELAKAKETIVNKTEELVAEVKPFVKKLTDLRTSDERPKREMTRAER